MNSFFANLVDRHLGICETIQPRKLSLFETDRGSLATASADAVTAPVQSDNYPTLQTPSEFSANSQIIANRKHDPVANNKAFPSTSHPEQKHPTRPALREEPIAFSDSNAESRKSSSTQSSDYDMRSFRAMPQPAQQDAPALEDKRHLSTINSLLTENDLLHKLAQSKNPAPTSTTGDHVLDNELNDRIRLMLMRLTDENRVPAQDDRGSQKNNTQSAILPETEVSSFEPAIPSRDLSNTSSRQAASKDKLFSELGKSQIHSQLEPPSWLTDMQSRLNHQHANSNQANVEPVINVTIGRVEVRAVQAETKNERSSKKPTGVMSLDDYLKQREVRGTR